MKIRAVVILVGLEISFPLPIFAQDKEDAKKRLPKLALASEAIDLNEQSSIYAKERNQAMRLNRMREVMLLAKERDQLIEKELVVKQLSYLRERHASRSSWRFA